MHRTLRFFVNDAFVRNALFGLLVLFAGASAGCAEKACFAWSPAEGACPTRAEAMQFFCPDTIGSVDSEAELKDGLCCYEVTKISDDTFLCDPVFVGEPRPEPFPSSGTGFGSCDEIGSCNTGETNCVSCAINNGCSFQFSMCQSTPACFEFSDCASACPPNDGICIEGCRAKFPAGADSFQQLVDCLFCQECFSSCSNATPVVPPVCSSGSSSSDSTGTFIPSTGSMGGMGGAGGMSGVGGMGGAP